MVFSSLCIGWVVSYRLRPISLRLFKKCFKTSWFSLNGHFPCTKVPISFNLSTHTTPKPEACQSKHKICYVQTHVLKYQNHICKYFMFPHPATLRWRNPFCEHILINFCHKVKFESKPIKPPSSWVRYLNVHLNKVYTWLRIVLITGKWGSRQKPTIFTSDLYVTQFYHSAQTQMTCMMQ